MVLEKYWQRASEAQNHNANIVVLDALSKDPNSYVRSLVAQNPNSNIEILTSLSKDENEEVRIEVARNPICNSEILANLSSDESAGVRREVATNLNTKPEILELLSKDQTESANPYPWELVRSAVAKNVNSTSSALETLSKDSNSYVRSVVGLNPNTSQEILGFLSRDEQEEVRVSVAGNPNTDPRVLLNLSRDSAKSAIATNPQSSLEILDLLSSDDDPDVRRNVASNPHSSLEILERLSSDDDTEVRCFVARNRNANSQILERLSRDGDDTVRRYIAEDDGANPDSLMILTQDSDYFIRFALAQNPQANLEILDILSRDENAQVRGRVAEHRLASTEILANLSRDRSPLVRSAVARSLNTPQETLRKLALDKSAEQGYRKVKSFVASNPNADSQILDVLSKDDDAEVRCQVARNPLTGLEILELLSRDDDAVVRQEVARNPHASLEILEHLSKELAEIGEELESEIVQELFRKVDSFNHKGKHQFAADILFELASDGDLRSTVELSNIFMEQEDFGIVEELLDDYPDEEDSTILYLRAKLSERTGSYDFHAYLKAAHAGNSSAALALVEYFATSDIYLAKRWLARAKEIGHPNIGHFHDMLTIKPREKMFLINVVTEEVRVFDAKGIELVSTFEDLHEAVLFCLSKEGGFDVLHVDENGDAHYSYFGSHMKVIDKYELIIAGDSDYWFGRLEDMQDAIEEVEGTFGNWDLVIYDSISYSSETDSQSPVEWFPIEDEEDDDEDEDEEEDEDEDEEDDDEGFGSGPETVSEPNWGSFRDFWINCELTITPRLLGFVDIEGGHVGISGKWISSCDNCSSVVSCADCGRNPSDYLHLRAGNGDGIYSVFEISFEEKVVGAFLILDDFGYAPALIESISEATNTHEEDPEVLNDFYQNFYEDFYQSIGYLDKSLQMHFFGDLEAGENPVYSRDEEAAGIIIFGESGQGRDSKQSLVTLNNILPGNYRTFVFANRDEGNNSILVPRSVLLLEENSAEEIGLTKDFAKPIDLHQEYLRWNESTVFARIGGPLAPYAISANKDWCDLRFARELRVEDFETARDMRMEWLSWLLMLQTYVPSPEIEELIKELALKIDIPMSTVYYSRGQFIQD